MKSYKEKVEGFANSFIGVRLIDKSSEGVEIFAKASSHFSPIAEEVAEIFLDGLLHVVLKGQDMITVRTDPDPKPAQESIYEEIYDKGKDTYEKGIKRLEDFYNKLKDIDI